MSLTVSVTDGSDPFKDVDVKPAVLPTPAEEDAKGADPPPPSVSPPAEATAGSSDLKYALH